MNYDSYIRLSEHYESVVDIDSDTRHKDMWKSYIVNADMQRTINAICSSLEYEDDDKRRSLWINGTYGTGKTYAAIVLKHLLEDDIDIVEEFMKRQTLSEQRTRFMNVRKRGKFLVVLRSGTADVSDETTMMIAMESDIKRKVIEMFGDKAYLGGVSLIDAAKEAVIKERLNWHGFFSNDEYDLGSEYGTFENFKAKVLDGDQIAVDKVISVAEKANYAVFAQRVELFHEWIKDIIKGNGLSETGIFYIWDEFTGYLRDHGEDDTLQKHSEFCKNDGAPFFMCLIIHRDPTRVEKMGQETYNRITDRYHKIDYHITETAAFDLIGDSIVTQPGKQAEWEGVRKSVIDRIKQYAAEFEKLELGSKIIERLTKLCPIHPMTLSLLVTVAQNFGASQRTLFQFMKDKKKEGEEVGFSYFIKHNSFDKWAWLTADYLWDYFFIKADLSQTFTNEATSAIRHYEDKYVNIQTNPDALHVFKAAMLLIAITGGSTVSDLHSVQSASRNK